MINCMPNRKRNDDDGDDDVKEVMMIEDFELFFVTYGHGSRVSYMSRTVVWQTFVLLIHIGYKRNDIV